MERTVGNVRQDGEMDAACRDGFLEEVTLGWRLEEWVLLAGRGHGRARVRSQWECDSWELGWAKGAASSGESCELSRGVVEPRFCSGAVTP